MTRAICAYHVGRTGDRDEFHNRVKFLFKHLKRCAGLGNVSVGGGLGKHGEDHERKVTLDSEQLRDAVETLAGIPKGAIPLADVQDLQRNYDLDQDGLSLDEFTYMLQDLCDQYTLFTGYETLENLSERQLKILRQVLCCFVWCFMSLFGHLLPWHW